MEIKRTVIVVVAVVLALSMIIACGSKSESPSDEPVTVTLDVAGMTCESCEEAIVHTVGEMDGVDMVESHHDPGTATVLYRPGRVSREAIVEEIEGLGYKVVNSEG
ncbi:MAG: hypothetical protein DRJ65_01015 [Acidobacteria bacterium]|nr:MAG: hypothetical protein DRJ65_01015 [Acidobacteriota bacterium]